MRGQLHRILAVIVFAAMFAAMAVPASAGSSDCDKNKAQIARIDQAIAQLQMAQLPRQVGKDLLAVLDELIDGLKGTKGDLGKITGSVDGAKSKLGDITKNLKDAKVAIPPAWNKLAGAVNGLADSIQSGVTKYEGSAAGKTAAGLAKAQDYIGKAVSTLQAVRDQVADLQTLDDARDGSAADQVRALKIVIDKTGQASGAAEVPGVKQFLDAYSQAVAGIADNVASIENSMSANIAMANKALEGTDFANGDLYLNQKTAAEKQAAALDALRQERARLVADGASLGCDEPPPVVDNCTHKKLGSNGQTPAETNALVDRMTAPLRNQYDTAATLVRIATNEALQNGFAKPVGRPGESQASFNARMASWRSTQDRLDAEMKKQVTDRDAIKSKLDQATGNAIAQEASAKNWSTADEQLFDECFPREGDLRKAAKQKAAQARSQTAVPSAAKPAAATCVRQGGLGGAMENVACQEQHAGSGH
ncbi:MAG TPA: hypothetical protein VMU22_04955 [Rhizomicrobium sp.]|nr:hypothetical protein [Rhizomicrobium sp.]